jgi:predicted  nucleic acid-binding Zn-ribbon protein
LVIALYNIDWHPSSQEDESLEAFLKRKNATMEKQMKEINEQKKTIVELKMEIKQLRDENLQLKINWEFEKKNYERQNQKATKRVTNQKKRRDISISIMHQE